MRKLILLLLSGMLSTACVDKDYDLGNIDTDNIAIGDEGSQFRIPLVKVLVSKDEIKNNGGNIEEIFREADIWFPSQLPDGKFVDLVKLQDKDDQTYVNTLLRTLREEMRTSDAKLASVVDLVWDKYAAEFLPLLNLTAPDEQTFKTAFKTAYRNDASLRERLADEVSALARTYLTGSLGIDQLEYEVGHIDISSDIVDMLADNLDPEGTPIAGTLAIHYGDITKQSFYKSYMGLIPKDRPYYARNSKGKMVPVQEVGWDSPNAVPTHMIMMFSAGCGTAYEGTIGQTLWVDNVALEY
mgnify:CR=1 FL=1